MTCRASKEMWAKFMQTCFPHLVSLIVFSTAVLLDLAFMRFVKFDYSQELANFMAIEFLLVPPVVNPLIYGFKLTKIRNKILCLVNIKVKDAKKDAF